MKWRERLKKALKVFLLFLKWPLFALKLIFEIPVSVIIVVSILVRTLFIVRPFSSAYDNFVRFYKGTVGKLIRLEIKGRENLPDGAFVVAARHRSIEDIGLIMSALSEREIVFLARNDLRRIRLIPFVEDYTIFINQGDPDPAPLKEACDHLGSGGILGIFPEGSRQEKLKEIRPGVLRLARTAEVPIVHLNLDTEGPYALRETSLKNVFFHFWNLLFLRIRVGVQIGEPIRFEELKDNYEQKAGKKITAKDQELVRFFMNQVVDRI